MNLEVNIIINHIPENEKVHLRHLFIELGLWCNLNCRHCFQGEMENISIRPEYIDALCEKVHEIDELSFTGGEVSLYVSEMRMVLNKLIDNHIKTNYVNIYTNAKERNEELVNLFNWFRKEHTTFPEKAIIQISGDRFHTSCDANFTEKELKENIQWFKEKCLNCNIKIEEKIRTMSIQGKALTMDKTDFFDVDEVIISRKEEPEAKIQYKCLCCENENLCGYGCVKNCIISDLTLGCDGYLYYGQMPPAFLDRTESNSIGHIMSESILNLIRKWNDRVKEVGTVFIKRNNNISLYALDTIRKILQCKKDMYYAAKHKNIKMLDDISQLADLYAQNWNDFIAQFRYVDDDKMAKEYIKEYNLIANEMGYLKMMTKEDYELANATSKLFDGLKPLFSVAYIKATPIVNILFSGTVEFLSEYDKKLYAVLSDLHRSKVEWNLKNYEDAWRRLKELQQRLQEELVYKAKEIFNKTAI